LCVAVFLVLACLCCNVAAAALQTQDDAERKRAFQLYKDANYTEALPVFEKLAAAAPNDREVVETLGFLVLGQAIYLKDAEARKRARLRAREILTRAEKMGADDALLKTMLAASPPDGGNDISFSTRKEVDEAMRDGEGAFAKGDYSKAIESYERALLFDARQYEAALFTGDAYYQLGQAERAGEWYAKAIAINPDRETAYRYWGDVLMKHGNASGARDKFIEAFIAEPYNRLARAAFIQWAQQNDVAIAHPKIDIPTSVTPLENGKMTVNLDANVLKGDDKNGTSAWIVYGLVRAAWATADFAKEYPEEKKYRHSLKEEAAALRAVIAALSNEKKDKDISKLDASLQTLLKLEKAGLLEAYILLATPDEGIAHDFATYRRANTDKLRRYLVEYVMTGGGN
jgi:tetratricopeptide (TPR) repeat protein